MSNDYHMSARARRFNAFLNEREEAVDHDYAVGDLTDERRKQIEREVRAKHRARWVSDCAGDVIDGGLSVADAAVAYPGGEADEFRVDVLGVVEGERDAAAGRLA